MNFELSRKDNILFNDGKIEVKKCQDENGTFFYSISKNIDSKILLSKKEFQSIKQIKL